MGNIYKWTLSQDYMFYAPFDIDVQREYHDESGRVWFTVDGSHCTIHAGYAWDGCSPKVAYGTTIMGTWDGRKVLHDLTKHIEYVKDPQDPVDFDQQLKYASLAHDVFCQFFDQLPICVTREKVDKAFYNDCKAVGFSLSWLYYQAVRVYSKYIRK